jgi:hypothetical protein
MSTSSTVDDNRPVLLDMVHSCLSMVSEAQYHAEQYETSLYKIQVALGLMRVVLRGPPDDESQANESQANESQADEPYANEDLPAILDDDSAAVESPMPRKGKGGSKAVPKTVPMPPESKRRSRLGVSKAVPKPPAHNRSESQANESRADESRADEHNRVFFSFLTPKRVPGRPLESSRRLLPTSRRAASSSMPPPDVPLKKSRSSQDLD